MSNAKRVVLNSGFLYGRMLLTVFISLYVTRIILEALGSVDFGIYNLVGGAVLLFTFLNASMTTASQRFMSFAQGQKDDEKQKTIFNVSFIFHILVAILFIIVLEIAVLQIFNGLFEIPIQRLETAKMIYHFMAVGAVFTIISVPYDAVLNAHENMIVVAIVGIIETLIKLFIALIIIGYNQDRLFLFGLLMLIVPLGGLLFKSLYCHLKYKEVTFGLKKYYHKQTAIEMSRFAGWSLLGSSSSMVAYYGQGLVLNMFFGVVLNAAQGIAAQVNGQLSAFSNVMMKALNPVIAKSEGAGNRDLMIKSSLLGSKISFFLVTFFFIPVLIETDYILNLWLTTVPKYAVIFCNLILIQTLVSQMFIPLGTSISAVGKIKNYFITTSLVNIAPLIISYFLFSNGLKPYYLYYAFIIAALLKGLLILYFSKKFFNLDLTFFAKNVLLRCTASFGLIYGLVYGISTIINNKSLALVVVICSSSIIFLISVYFIGLNNSEKKMFHNLISSFYVRFLKFSKATINR